LEAGKPCRILPKQASGCGPQGVQAGGYTAKTGVRVRGAEGSSWWMYCQNRRPGAGRRGFKLVDLWEEMELDGIRPDDVIFEIFMAGCTRTRRMGDLMFFWGEFRRRGFQPTVKIYSRVITTCALSGAMEIALKVMLKFLTQFPKPPALLHSHREGIRRKDEEGGPRERDTVYFWDAIRSAGTVTDIA
jgi:hypothetical protein